MKTIQVHDSSSFDDTTTPSKKVKLSYISQDIFNLIQEKSDIFLTSMLEDLDAYSRHRANGKISLINLSDVILYLKRTNFTGLGPNKKMEICLLYTSRCV